jgi:hypothetical protein
MEKKIITKRRAEARAALKWGKKHLKLRGEIKLKITKDMPSTTGGYVLCPFDGKIYVNARELRKEIGQHPAITVLHELVHVKQMRNGKLKFHPKTNGVLWRGGLVNLYNTYYKDLPHERQAYRLEKRLFKRYKEKS